MSLLSSASNNQPPRALPGFEDIRRTWSAVHKAWSARILPGEYYVSKENEVIVTVLGSCVSACVRDPATGVGGMNHFMLPDDGGKSNMGDHCLDESTRYGTNAMEHMINDILKHGGRRNNLEFKLFGGGRIMDGLSDVGEKNVDFIREYLIAEGYSISSEDLGGDYPRKVLYFPFSGRVLMKKMPISKDRDLIERENAYKSTLQRKPCAGEVELF